MKEKNAIKQVLDSSDQSLYAAISDWTEIEGNLNTVRFD